MSGRRGEGRHSNWYKRAVLVISAAIAKGGTTDEQRRRADAAYPFGLRAHWPYRCWLAARADLFAHHGMPTPRQIVAAARRQAEARTIRPAPLAPVPDPNQQAIPFDQPHKETP